MSERVFSNKSELRAKNVIKNDYCDTMAMEIKNITVIDACIGKPLNFLFE